MTGKYEWWPEPRYEWNENHDQWERAAGKTYYWHYRAPGNHEIIYQGKTTGYMSKRACMRAIELAQQSKGAEIREVG